MNTHDYKITLSVNKPASEVFQSINDIQSWWSEDYHGAASKLNDEFEVNFGDVHYSKQKLIAVIPNQKVSWLVTESRLSFLKNKSEWNDTIVHFEIESDGNTSKIHFTHEGLVPEIECYGDCSNGWNHFLKLSLVPFINTGTGNPNVLENEIKEKSNQK